MFTLPLSFLHSFTRLYDFHQQRICLVIYAITPTEKLKTPEYYHPEVYPSPPTSVPRQWQLCFHFHRYKHRLPPYPVYRVLLRVILQPCQAYAWQLESSEHWSLMIGVWVGREVYLLSLAYLDNMYCPDIRYVVYVYLYFNTMTSVRPDNEYGQWEQKLAMSDAENSISAVPLVHCHL